MAVAMFKKANIGMGARWWAKAIGSSYEMMYVGYYWDIPIDSNLDQLAPERVFLIPKLCSLSPRDVLRIKRANSSKELSTGLRNCLLKVCCH